MSALIWVGIDNGISGGLAAISDHHAQIISTLPMPVLKARKGQEIDVASVAKWMASLESELSVMIEEPGGSKSARAASSMAGSFHALRTICVLRKHRWNRVTPNAWQKVLLPGCSGDTKPRALTLAKQLWPDEEWPGLTPKSKKVHDGVIDAALIAYYARRVGL